VSEGSKTSIVGSRISTALQRQIEDGLGDVASQMLDGSFSKQPMMPLSESRIRSSLQSENAASSTAAAANSSSDLTSFFHTTKDMGAPLDTEFRVLPRFLEMGLVYRMAGSPSEAMTKVILFLFSRNIHFYQQPDSPDSLYVSLLDRSDSLVAICLTFYHGYTYTHVRESPSSIANAGTAICPTVMDGVEQLEVSFMLDDLLKASQELKWPSLVSKVAESLRVSQSFGENKVEDYQSSSSEVDEHCKKAVELSSKAAEQGSSGAQGSVDSQTEGEPCDSNCQGTVESHQDPDQQPSSRSTKLLSNDLAQKFAALRRGRECYPLSAALIEDQGNYKIRQMRLTVIDWHSKPLETLSHSDRMQSVRKLYFSGVLAVLIDVQQDLSQHLIERPNQAKRFLDFEKGAIYYHNCILLARRTIARLLNACGKINSERLNEEYDKVDRAARLLKDCRSLFLDPSWNPTEQSDGAGRCSVQRCNEESISDESICARIVWMFLPSFCLYALAFIDRFRYEKLCKPIVHQFLEELHNLISSTPHFHRWILDVPQIRTFLETEIMDRSIGDLLKDRTVLGDDDLSALSNYETTTPEMRRLILSTVVRCLNPVDARCLKLCCSLSKQFRDWQIVSPKQGAAMNAPTHATGDDIAGALESKEDRAKVEPTVTMVTESSEAATTTPPLVVSQRPTESAGSGSNSNDLSVMHMQIEQIREQLDSLILGPAQNPLQVEKLSAKLASLLRDVAQREMQQGQAGANAQFELGHCYSNGHGVSQDFKQAVE